MEHVGEEGNVFIRQIRATSHSDELVQASEGHYVRLVELADVMGSMPYSKPSLARDFQALQCLSHQKMQNATSTTRWAWQILYVDSCVLHSIILSTTSTVCQSICLLDQAIIIAGGGDENRLELILLLINNAQQKLLPPPTHSHRLLNKGHHSSFEPLFTASNQVPSIDSNLSFLSFQNAHSKNPFVIRGFAHDWPALNENPWNSIDYLVSASGSSRLVPVEVGHDYRDEHWNQVLMGWEDFLYALDDTQGTSNASRDNLYLAQHNLLRQFPSLRNDIVIPDYVYCSLTPRHFSGYKAPEIADGAILNVWLGPEGATSPAHFDPYHNLYVQIVGYKTVWLSPPQTTLYMEVCPSMKRQEDCPVSDTSIVASKSTSPNTSRLDVFSGGRIAADFPVFADRVIPQAMSVVLGPGDLLFFPPGWWHGMRSESTSFSVSMWF